MLKFILYIIETSLIMCVFYLYYKYVYFKLAYFEWNRYFLIFGLMISIILPSLSSPFSIENFIFNINNNNVITTGFGDNYTLFVKNISRQGNKIPFFNIISLQNILTALMLIWFLKFGQYAIRILINMKHIYKLSKNSKRENYLDNAIYKTQIQETAFSFFKKIFVGKKFETLTPEQQNKIIMHERVHVSQLHSIDNTIFEIFRAIFWFNPLIKKTVQSVKENHEFIADTIVSGNKISPQYARLILELSINQKGNNLKSNFSDNEIKNRIEILSNPESVKIRKKRFIISIPVIIILIIGLYIAVSSINMYAGTVKSISVYAKPFDKGNYKILAPFFKEKKINNKTKETIIYSHEKISYKVNSFSPVYAIADGKIISISKFDNYGINEFIIKLKINRNTVVVYKGLYKVTVLEETKVKKGERIGETGDIRLFPKVSLQILRNNKPINPVYCY